MCMTPFFATLSMAVTRDALMPLKLMKIRILMLPDGCCRRRRWSSLVDRELMDGELMDGESNGELTPVSSCR